MLSKFLDPKNDVCFKKIFGTEKNKDILIHFLNDMLAFKGRSPITDVTFLKTVQDPDIALQKSSLVDVLCKDSAGNQYIVEIQVAKEKGFEKRAQYYAAKAYCSQSRVGGAYANLKESIFLAIADFVMFPEKAAYKSDHVILDRASYENDLKDFSFTFLELPKFKKSGSELKTIVEKWIYFFKEAEGLSEEEAAAIIGTDEIMERAYDELSRFSWSDEELLTYDQAEKYYSSYVASMEQKYEDGVIKGVKEGKEIGVKEGKIEVARNMLKSGLSLEMITQITGLSLSEVKSLTSS